MFENQRVGISSPFHARNVVLVRIAGDLHPLCFPADGRHDTDANGGILCSGLRVGNLSDCGINAEPRIRDASLDSVRRSRVIDQGEVLDLARIKLPVGNALAVWAPAKSVAYVELFFVDPV